MLLSTPALDIQYKYMEYNGYKTSSIKTRETVEIKCFCTSNKQQMRAESAEIRDETEQPRGSRVLLSATYKSSSV